MTVDGLSHIDEHGHARMVNVTEKDQTQRDAIARCTVSLSPAAIESLTQSQEADPLGSARVTGIQAAKQTWDLIPLCHPLLIGDVVVEFVVRADRIEIEARVDAFGRTGVEMEALTACAAAALAIYYSCRTLDPLAAITDLAVWEKRGGRSGSWRRVETDEAASD